MKKRHVFCLMMVMVLITLTSISLIAEGAAEEEERVITFWSGPAAHKMEAFKTIVDRWNKAHPEIKVDWKPTPAGVSSEEVLLTAIASGTAPDVTANTFLGFAETLVASKAVVPLEEFSGFWEVMKVRHMKNIIEMYKSGDGHYYLIPLYSNAMMWSYNSDILREVGLDKPPRTYSELLSLAPKVVIPDERWLVHQSFELKWWHVWYTYMMLYYAAGEGTPFVKGDKATFINKAGLAAAKFGAELFAKGYAPLTTLRDPMPTGKVLAGTIGPWNIRSWKSDYPNYNYLLAPPPVPDWYPSGKPIYTFSDAKGLVMLTQCKPEKREEAWEFMKWLYTTPENDLTWLELDGEPCSREDLLTNPVFQEFFKKNPKIKEFAEMVPFAVPPPTNPEVVAIQTIFQKEAWQPIVFGKKTPEQALEDAKREIEKYLAF